MSRRIRILVAKPGLDGHDRGAKVVAHALRDAGMEVIYTGLHQSVDEIVSAAIQEDVDVVGLSVMSGAHLVISQKVLDRLREKQADDVMVVVGGVIPNRDKEKLEAIGVSGIFPGGTHFTEFVRFLEEKAGRRL